MLWTLALMKRVCLLLASLCLPRAASAAGPGITLAIPQPTRITLANGLKVIVMEDHTTPLVSLQVWYHVGSKNEVPGKRGIAHMFEHLMFRGTTKYAPGVFDDRLDSVGGVNNAFTGEDVTVYHEEMPTNALDVALDLEADRMRGLKLVQANIDSEREVVKEEKRLKMDNDPLGQTLEAFRALAYSRHPYGWTPAGTLADLDSVTVAQAQAFYDRWYLPNNAVMVIAGDVLVPDVEVTVHRFFDAIPRGPDPSREIPAEPPQTAERTRTLHLDTELCLLVGGYHVPGILSADIAPLEILGVILSQGESSRMYSSLVRSGKLAVFAAGDMQVFEDPGLFLVEAGFADPAAAPEVTRALLAQIEQVAAKGITATELEKARNQLLAGHVFGLETVEGKGMSLGRAETLEGDYRKFLDETTKYERVTAEQVQEVARRYLVRSNLTLLTVLPESP